MHASSAGDQSGGKALAELSLSDMELHLWFIDLDEPDRMPPRCSVLSPDELSRAAAFRQDRLRDRYIRSHTALRKILGCYLGLSPDAVSFGVAPGGKPFVLHDETTISFSLAHSENLAVVAIARNRELGVDVEVLRPISDAISIASRFFHTAEAQFVLKPQMDTIDGAFLRIWTKKEAFTKCLGQGLFLPFDSFSVLAEPVLTDYNIEFVPVPRGYVGAVAYRRPSLIHKVFRWNDAAVFHGSRSQPADGRTL